MKRSFLIIAVLLVAIVLCGCRSSSKNQRVEAKSQKSITATSEQRQFSKKAYSIIHNLGLDSRPASLRNLPKTDSIPASKDFERVIVLPPAGMSDGFTHTITIDHKKKVYWISRTGGIAGVFEKYGPIKF